MADKQVVASWSGGIDSTGVVANLLRRGYDVHAVTLNIYGGEFGKREKRAREQLWSVLADAGNIGGGKFETTETPASWIWAFSPDGFEIPRRNKHIIDHLITAYCMPKGITNIAMGEYIGADSWLVSDHVGAADADARSLGAYIFNEYGLDYRMFTLADFGESRYKVDRLRLLVEGIGSVAASKTSNCLYDYDEHCGACYKCVERAAAFDLLSLADLTVYLEDPRANKAYPTYKEQMTGRRVNVPFAGIKGKKIEAKMPVKENA